jgi:hypothetical protein
MADDQRAMYDEFSDKGGHSTEWVQITKDLLNLAFACGCLVVKCPCKKCGNYKILPQYDMQGHLIKDGFMPNYLMWRDHEEVELPVASPEFDRNEDEDRIDDMIADIRREYDPCFGEWLPCSEVQNFYRLLDVSNEKVHDGTDVTVLQVVTCLIALKSKYNFSNQCYNDIIKLIIDLIPSKHNMPNDLYQSKKILASLSINYEEIDVCEELHIVLEGAQGRH